MLILITLLFSSNVFSSEPESLQLWKSQSDFFWKMDFSNEEKFKVDLSNYYRRIYTDEILDRVLQWVNNGRLESEHYSWRFNNLRDTKIKKFKNAGKNLFRVKAVQNSCYHLNYNHPNLETLVDDYKVSNYTQIQVDEWLATLLPESEDAEICLKVFQKISLTMGTEGKRIVNEKWDMTKSSLKLKSKKLVNKVSP